MTRDDAPTFLSARHLPAGGSLLAGLEAHWRAIRGARALPARSDLDPGALDAVLPWAFVAERVAPGVARLRVAGQKLTGLLGMEARGMPLCAFFSPEGRAVLCPLVERVFDGPAIVGVPVVSARRLARPRLTGRMILLPLGDGDGRATRAIGALLCDGAPGRMPARFGIGGGEIRCEALAPPAPRLAVNGGAAAKRPDASRPALRLVVSRP